MKTVKRGRSLILALAICLCIVMPAAAETVSYLSPDAITGRDITDTLDLAEALDRVFQGHIGMYTNATCTGEAVVPLGDRVNNSKQYYIKNNTTGGLISGWQCYAYANAVYNELFGETIGHGASLRHSEVVISGGARTVSYEMFAEAGVRCGAYLRTTANSSGSFSGSYGHSMLILAYDAETVTYLEGNGDGNGLVRVVRRDWAGFNRSMLTNKGRYVCHVIQPTEEYYQANYPGHDYDETGVCARCGEAYDWARTLSVSVAGSYHVLKDCTSHVSAPYFGSPLAADLRVGQTVEVKGRCINALGEAWYQATDAQGQTVYVPADSLYPRSTQELQITVTNFSPADDAMLKPVSQPVIGTVTSNYPLRAIYGYLDGAYFTAWEAEDQKTLTVELRSTAINDQLSFRALAQGDHELVLVAMSYAQPTPVTILETSFYMVSSGDVPGRPSLSGMKEQYDHGETVTFRWKTTANTTNYELLLSVKDEQGQWSEPQVIPATSGMSLTLPAGAYRAAVRAYNAAYPGIYTDSYQYAFTVLPAQYTVRYDANGGEVSPADQLKTHGTALVLSAEVPQRDGYTFLGWAMAPDAAQADFQPGDSYTADEDLTLYAIWQQISVEPPEETPEQTT